MEEETTHRKLSNAPKKDVIRLPKLLQFIVSKKLMLDSLKSYAFWSNLACIPVFLSLMIVSFVLLPATLGKLLASMCGIVVSLNLLILSLGGTVWWRFSLKNFKVVSPGVCTDHRTAAMGVCIASLMQLACCVILIVAMGMSFAQTKHAEVGKVGFASGGIAVCAILLLMFAALSSGRLSRIQLSDWNIKRQVENIERAFEESVEIA